ncbi:MAG: glycoside hydrolase family 28 protein [Defluviitaleaceae bacterium]|nr:glycoside hydrolase family 28 protein [Defluviitaleaceae bacterium]
MVKVITATPFGFAFELENDDCFFTGEYEIHLNGTFYKATDKNAVAIYGLKPNTSYDVQLKGKDISFTVKTETPNYVINVRDYNALGDGVTDDTSAINAAVYTAVAGSVVYIPKGEYLVDQIFLKSDVDIYLERGAVIKQNTERKKLAILKGYQRDYSHESPQKALINASWEGHPLDCYCALIYGNNINNVRVYGEGTIDGNGDAGDFWINPKVKNRAYRPKNILLVNCGNITVSGITSRNSASWNIHPLYCTNISFSCMKIESGEDSPNTDGINPESSSDVSIVGCRFNVGDDCVAIKAGKYYMSTARLRPSEDITIRNCFMEKGHGGVVIGSEMSCGVYRVSVSRCVFRDTDRGLRIKTRRGRGKHAIVDGIAFDNIIMQGVRHGFVVNMYYFCDPDGKSDYVRDKNPREKDELTPTVKNITVTNVRADRIRGSAVFIYGLPESCVTGVRLTDNVFTFAPDNERVLECPAMMDDFTVTEKLDFYIKNCDDVFIKNNEGIVSSL